MERLEWLGLKAATPVACGDLGALTDCSISPWRDASLVGEGRLELPWISPYAPEAYVSANFTTRPKFLWAKIISGVSATSFNLSP